MDELNKFVEKITAIHKVYEYGELDIDGQRDVIREINDFLYSSYDGIGKTEQDGLMKDYYSDYHKYWSKHYSDILSISINREQCEKVAKVLHQIYINSRGKAFTDLNGKYTSYGLSNNEICLIRFTTANQDFRTSLKFDKLVDVYKSKSDIFNIDSMNKDPNAFLVKTSIKKLSQDDKRISFVKNLTDYLLNKKCEPIDLIKKGSSTNRVEN